MQHNRRILIVDDQQDLREQLAKLLLRSGRNNETSSLVQGMRARLGMKEGQGENAGARSINEVEYEVDTVGQGEDAFKMVQRAIDAKQPYAIMFTDMRMPPGWDGLETAKRVREIDKNIEIVIMTAFADHDQKKVADIIGTPHKLLYIKKPFQSEEIFQLALALSSKWNFEETERVRKEWLENLIRCLGKVKTSSGGGLPDVFASILKSLLSFCGSSRGFIAACDETGEWDLKTVSGLEKEESESFIKENSDRLRDSRTTLSFANKYVLPLRRDASSYIACIYDLDMQNDPEWYKMLSLLVMTAGEVLSTALLASSTIRKEQITTLTRAVNKISNLELDAYSGIGEALGAIEAKLGSGDPAVEKIRSVIADAEKRLNRIHDVLLLGEADAREHGPATLSRFDEALRRACDEASSLCGNFKVVLECTGDTDLQSNIPADLLHRAFRNMALNSCEAAQEAGRSQVTIAVEIKDVKTSIAIRFKDDGPGIPDAVKGEFFEPFVSSGERKLGIGLAAARMIFERFGGSIYFDVKAENGAVFNIKLPQPGK